MSTTDVGTKTKNKEKRKASNCICGPVEKWHWFVDRRTKKAIGDRPSKLEISQSKSSQVEFLVKNSQFEFLVMKEKNIFFYKHFLALDISDISYFYAKILRPWKRSSLFPSKPLLNIEVLLIPTPFWKFGRRFNPTPSRNKVGCTLWACHK